MIIPIIIPIYNRLEVTKNGLSNLYKALDVFNTDDTFKSRLKFEVIIVDDGSSDGSYEWIEMNYPNVYLLRGNGDLWWSGAINKGAKFSISTLKADYVLLWNDDTVCDIDYFIELGKLLFSDSNSGNEIFASKVLWLNQKDVLFNFGCYYNRKNGRKGVIGYNQKDSQEYSMIREIDWSGGMGTLIPSAIMLDLEYFDNENFPQYHGDSDFFLRAQAKGYRSFVVPQLRMYNNPETTGLVKCNTFKQLQSLLTSNRSLYNFRHNLTFNRRHSNTLLSWFFFYGGYAKFLVKCLKSLI